MAEWRERVREAGKTLVVTNGCFDLLHPGHATYLETARAQGDALLVGITGDQAVRRLKGSDRPVNPENARAALVAALASVDGVCIFDEVRADRFLSVARPDIYVKGGDYAEEELPAEERRVIRQQGGRIVMLPYVPGKSTSELIAQIRGLHGVASDDPGRSSGDIDR